MLNNFQWCRRDAANHARRPPSASSRVVVGVVGPFFIEKRANRFTGGWRKHRHVELTRVCVTRAIAGLFMPRRAGSLCSAFLEHVANCTLCITHGVIKWNRRNFVHTGEFRRLNKACRPAPWVSTQVPSENKPYQRYAARAFHPATY